MGDLVNVPIGSVGAVDLSFDAGKLKLSVSAAVTVDDILSMVENAIPGDIDNKLIDGLKAILDKV